MRRRVRRRGSRGCLKREVEGAYRSRIRYSMEKDENGARCRRYGQDGGDVSEGGQGMTVYRPSFPRVMESGTSS